MARKTKAEKEREALEAETALNTNPKGTLIRPGQIWKDMNPRSNGRLVNVIEVNAGVATVVDGKRTSPVSVDRMYPHARGYEIYGSP